MKVKNQKTTDRYAIYNGDSCEVLKALPDESVGFTVFSPPFCDLYSYSEDPEDLGNSRSPGEFFKHFSYITDQLHRITMPGRIIAVHCVDLPVRKQDAGYFGLYDFPGDVVKHFVEHGFIYHSRHCIWKDPLILFMRTKTAGLAHKQIVSDSSLCRMGCPEQVLAFRKKGDNPVPIQHPEGLTIYHGQRQVPRHLSMYEKSKDPKTNKRSHWIWQQYASPVWMDIRQMKVLHYKEGREKDDEKHICPLQIDAIERCLTLWSTEGDVVLTPFMGVGSEVYCAVRNGRKGVGIELKTSYYKQALRNLGSWTRNGA